MWYLYILQCSDNTYYTGITKNLDKRIQEHNTSTLGAKYTKGRRPVKLVYTKKYHNQSLALKAEHQTKKLSKKAKKHLTQQA